MIIICLRGYAKRGKSTTLRMLSDLLRDKLLNEIAICYWRLKEKSCKNIQNNKCQNCHKDFCAKLTFKKDVKYLFNNSENVVLSRNINVGICTYGDVVSLWKKRKTFEFFKKHNVEIVFCPARKCKNPKRISKTEQYLRSVSDDVVIIDKTVSSNKNDFNKINLLDRNKLEKYLLEYFNNKK